MPTYEYECDACDHRFDEFQSITDEPLKDCPECGKPKLRRLFGTGAAVLFKGSGFYQTDYRSESYKSAAKAEQEKTSKSSDGDGKKAPAAGGAKKDDSNGSKTTN
jgi:putative FmdB family regulatory protein